MADNANEGQRRDVGCPFCGLVCDDLTIDSAGGRLNVVAAGCPLSRERFAEHEPSASPTVDGRASDLPAAVTRAAEVLATARAPVFVVAADVAGTRAVLRLADRLGGVVDHPDSDALFRNLRVVQDAGSLTTTLSEVRNRADLVLTIGPDPSSRSPRFFERCIEPRRTFLGEQPLQRQLFRLGPPAAEQAGMSPAPTVTELPCTMERLPEAIAALSALLRGREVPALDGSGFDRDRLALLADRFKEARYAVVVWAPAMFDMSDGELVAQALLDLVRYASRSTRCSVLPLGGGANLFGVHQVCTWQTGYSIRTAFGRGIPEHDPYRFSARRMIEQGEADALVWISSFGRTSLPPLSGVPTVLLAPPGAAPTQPVAAYIPVGIPGVDHAGQLFRTDGVVALRLSALRTSALPDVGAVMTRIETELGRKGTPR
jgi:formylmethanofuran dehydrogenase subunit B